MGRPDDRTARRIFSRLYGGCMAALNMLWVSTRLRRKFSLRPRGSNSSSKLRRRVLHRRSRSSSRRSSSSNKVSDSNTGLPVGNKAVPCKTGSVLSPRPSSRRRLRSGLARRPLPGPETPRFSQLSARRAHTKPPYTNELLWRTPRALNRPGMARTAASF